jgi:hypothetical protein
MEVEIALERGRRFLQSKGCERQEYLWIEKVTYRSDFLMETYVQAGLHSCPKRLTQREPSVSAAEMMGVLGAAMQAEKMQVDGGLQPEGNVVQEAQVEAALKGC